MMEPSLAFGGVVNVSSAPADLAAFYPRAYQRLVGTLRVMGVPSADAVELAQDAFVKLIPRWSSVKDYDSPDAWLRTVAWRLWLNRRRGDRLHLVADPPGGEQAGPDAASVDLEVALAGLAEGMREVVVLHYLTDRSVAQIATELDVAEGTVKSRLHRARAALAAALSVQEDQR